MKQARKEAVRRLGGLLYNDDGVDYQQPRTPAEFIAARLGPMANTQVGLVTLDPLDVDNIAIYPSKVLQVTKYPLLRAGHDPIAVALEFCHSHNLQFFPSFRMNDVHESRHKNWARTAIWKRENPHCLLGKHGDDHRYPMSSPRAWWAAKDYAVAEVRDRQFLVIEEMCEMYDLDGVELDWLRSPLFFEPTMDLEPVAQKHIDIMNQFVRRIRRMTERVAKKRSRPLLVAVRVPMSVERSLAIGLDVQTWLREDLADVLIVGAGYVPMAMAQSVRNMVAFARPFDVPVYACISASGLQARTGYDTVEAWRGAAMNVFQGGAKGVYLFNFPYGLLPSGIAKRHAYSSRHTSPKQAQLYHELGSAETLKGLDKVYGIDYKVTETSDGSTRPGLVLPDRLPLKLTAGRAATARLPVGEDLVANVPPGKTPRARLRLRLSRAGLVDDVVVRLNGRPLAADRPREVAPPATPANLLINPAFEQGEEPGESVPGWRGSGYDGSKHVAADFVIHEGGLKGSRAALLESLPTHKWVLADQHVPVQIAPSQAVELSVRLRAEEPGAPVFLVLYLQFPKQKRYDAAKARASLNVGTAWREYRTILALETATDLPASLGDAQIRAIIQIYKPSAKLYVDDAALTVKSSPCIELGVPASLVRAGDNLIDLEMTNQRSKDEFSLERLDLEVTYE